MKKFFRGFTLAELLLCVGVIGIVSAMGMTVAKIGTDKAYNSYYYAGYINLYNAIADAKSRGKETNSDIMNHARDLLSKDNVVATLPDTNIKFLTYKAVWACTNDDFNGTKYGQNCMDVPVPLDNNGCGIYNGSRYCVSCPPGYWQNGVCTCKKQGPNGECLDETPQPEIEPVIPIEICPIGKEEVNGVCKDKCAEGQTRDEKGVCQNKCPEGQIRDENGVCRDPEEEQEAFVWPTPDNSVVIETVNGIKYYYPRNLSDDMNGVQQLTGNISGVKSAFPITMTVPQRQTRANNGIATVHLIYIDLNGGYLIPVTDDESVDLQNRRDLLPAYIDNGKVGRNNNVVNRANWTYERPAYRSYREAYCLLKGSVAINNVISCNGITANQDGVLAIANPQKAR